MADATRNVKVRFTGDSTGVEAASKRGQKAMDDFERQANKSMKGFSAAGSAASDGLMDVLGALPSQLKGAAIVAAVGIGAVMAPALASAIISGVLLAVGGGVLAAGIVGAAKHPRVTRAWQRFGQQAGKTFERFSKPFIQPLINAADIFARALRRAEPTIQAIGRAIAPVLDKLPIGIAMMAENLLPGIHAAVQASVPLFDTLSAHMPGLGAAVSGFFAAIAAGGPAAKVFFDGFLTWVEKLLPKLGEVTTWVANFGVKLGEFVARPEFNDFKAALTKLKDDTLAGIKDAFNKVDVAVDGNSESWGKLGGAITKLVEVSGPAVKWFIGVIADSIVRSIDLIAMLIGWIEKLIGWIDRAGKAWKRLTGQQKVEWVQPGGIPANLPEFHGGGVVPGPRGAEVPILAQGGETVRTPEQEAALRSGPIEVVIPIHIGNEVTRVVRHEISEHDRQVRRRATAWAGA